MLKSRVDVVVDCLIKNGECQFELCTGLYLKERSAKHRIKRNTHIICMNMFNSSEGKLQRSITRCSRDNDIIISITIFSNKKGGIVITIFSNKKRV